ncbi:uncharacterized protein THITE_2111072 [Thermothielavioides terrestris NRRL 8126]|uniref:Uncharacterized protein n=1 Tax=Thermothielavioides terrestris (strain ATCC 38088 / NRRL 8126) TaxID=578455 RepID=G2QWI0_THETT|nr:uncharacterized protein THITE_2111072 [Thermothielavioides terrestris NRRL 8126]AEO64755.1 hypothetical protein THITE_2111072 [Thermothielavioides terrestris NRRL 8126]
MAERDTPRARFLHRFRPPIPSFLGSSAAAARASFFSFSRAPRPASSAYSGEGLRGAPDTVVGTDETDEDRDIDMDMDGGDGGPKSPAFPPSSSQYRIRAADLRLPGSRLQMPGLARTWTQDSSHGLPTARPGTAAEVGVAAPEPVVLREGRGTRHAAAEGVVVGHGQGDLHRERRRKHRHRQRERERRHRREGSGSGSRSRSDRARSGRSHRSGRSGTGSSHRSSQRSRDEESRSERRARRERERRRRREDGESGTGSERRQRRPPKHFLFCFPWIKSRRIRSQILRCFVSGTFLTLTLAVYLSLSLTKNVSSNEFTIVLVLILLAVTVFFCHSLVRLLMLVVKARKREQAVQRGQLPEMISRPGGYAIPREPIPVVLARDEEAAGIESEATKTGPPAYGMWRESVVCAIRCQQMNL